MATLPDLIYLALSAVAMPLWDHLVFWPAFHRRSEVDPIRARIRLSNQAIVGGWVQVAVGAALWRANDRSWTTLGFSVPDGWRLWTSIALFLLLAAYFAYAIPVLARSSDERASLRQRMGTLTTLLPHTRTDMVRFGGVSLTAGFCEEFLYRGYFIWVFAPWLGWWGAAALSLLLFAGGHAFQGWKGALGTGVAGAFFVLVVAVFDSLWPAIALHALYDVGQGTIAWLALREGGGDSRG